MFTLRPFTWKCPWRTSCRECARDAAKPKKETLPPVPPRPEIDYQVLERGNEVGGRFRIGGRGNRPWVTVAGIVKDVRHNGITDIVKEKFYIPHTQWHRSLGNANLIRAMTLVVRTQGNPSALTAQVKNTIRELDPNLPVADVRTMEQWVARSLETRRASMTLLTIFGAVALLLSAIGIYGVLAFGVAQRIREFGIRQALGADRASILSLVLKQGLRTAGVGMVLGLALSIILGRFLETLLFGVTAHDVTVVASVMVLLFVVAMVACYVPARRATRVDPMVALRDS